MAMSYGDTLNQTFPGLSSNNDEDLHHRTFHTPSAKTKSNAFNFEQQFLFDNAFHSITYQPPTVSCQQMTTEHLDRLCYSPKPLFSPRLPVSMPTKTSSQHSTNRFNPFRAFVIVNRVTSSIISVNRQACEYFWYTETELKSKTIDQLILNEKSSTVITDSFLNEQNGQTKILAGKIVHVLLGTGERAQFSLFIQDLDGENQVPLRFYAFEPIHIMEAKLKCDKHGWILSSDQNFSILFHNTMIQKNQANEHQHIGEFLPALKDKMKFKHLLTHRTYRTTGLLNNEKNLFLPLTIQTSKINDEDNIQLILSIMSSISGFIMLDETYNIRAYNPYFVQCLLGYRSLDLINHSITEIIPDFNGNQSNNLSISTTNEHDEENLSCQSLADDDEASTSDGSSNTLNDSSIDTTPQSSRVFNSIENRIENDKSQANFLPVDKRLTTGGMAAFKTTSTPVTKSSVKSELKIDSDEQTVFLQTIAKHKNGTSIAVTYSLNRLDLSDGTYRYCLWLSRDNTDPHLIEMQKLHEQSQLNLTMDELSGSFFNHSSSLLNEHSTFDAKYTITRQRGRGGYGQVYLGCEKSDESKKVVIKFIKKTKVKLHRYVESFEPKKKILLEVAILKQLKHRNIVEILDAFDTENYVQMIMPLHGQGIDLYEFVEKGARIDEPLASYIFRQVVDAVNYLHQNHIAHQDIKDENLIINEQFHIKLIDFGSAISITQPNMYTNNFGGTTEFCCPEFFQTGSCQPFLADIWAMMVTLYVIIFRRYPFLNPDEIKRCQLDLKFLRSRVSEELEDLFRSTLIGQPYHRLTIHEIENHEWTQQPFSLELYSWNVVTQNSLEETFLTGNPFQSAGGDEENSNDHSFASLTRQIQSQFHLFEKNPPQDKSQEEEEKNNLLAYLNCKHASI